MELVKNAKPRIRKRKGLTKEEWQLYSLCVIPILLIFVFKYIPMGGLVIAFKDYRFDKGIFGSEWVGFKNFEFFLTSQEFSRITWNTLSMNFLFIVFGTSAAILVGVLLFGLKSRLATKIFQTTMITPHFLSWVVVSYMVYGFLNPNFGIINTLMKNLGIEPINWYSEPKVWPAILVLGAVWKNVGMDSVIYYATLMGIDSSLFEAADIDGAGPLKKFKVVILPELVPLITILTIIKIGNIFRADFGLFYQVPRNVSMLYSTTDVIDTYVFRAMRVIGDMGMGSAIGFLQSIVGFVLVVLTNYITGKVNPENTLF